MATGQWVLRPGNTAKTVFIVSAVRDSLAPIADRVASPNYFLVVGSPDGIGTLVRSIKFDLVVVLANVARAEIARIEMSLPQPAPALLTDVTDPDLAVVLRRHLS